MELNTNIDFVRLENPIAGNYHDLEPEQAVDVLTNALEVDSDWMVMVSVFMKGEEQSIGRMLYRFEVDEREDIVNLLNHLAALNDRNNGETNE